MFRARAPSTQKMPVNPVDESVLAAAQTEQPKTETVVGTGNHPTAKQEIQKSRILYTFCARFSILSRYRGRKSPRGKHSSAHYTYLYWLCRE